MNHIVERFKPENLPWSWVFGILGFLLCLNLFGPKGLLHLVLLEQQDTRLKNEVVQLQEQIDVTREEINSFEHDPLTQKRVLRSRMGYLKPGEFRFEFVTK
ncbi:MAG: septum formation initiator family protein [Bdellovibrionota bacterium]